MCHVLICFLVELSHIVNKTLDIGLHSGEQEISFNRELKHTEHCRLISNMFPRIRADLSNNRERTD